MENSEDKLRLRSNDELELQAKGLKEFTDIMVKLEIPYFIGGGTLLGIVRDGDLIPWDWDLEIDTRTEDIFNKKDIFLSTLIENGFEILPGDYSYRNFKINAKKYNARYELRSFYLKGKMRYRKSYRLPSKFFDKPGTVTLRGYKFHSLSPAEEYLRFNYGDWRTPVKSDDKSVYLTLNTRTRLKALKIIYKTIKQKIFRN